MGSGATVRDDALVVVAPCNTMECIYSIRSGDDLWFSNSIVALLVAVDDELDPAYPDYESDVISISKGLSKYKRTLPTRAGNSIGLHYFCNIVIRRDGTVCSELKPEPPSFAGYDDYKRLLSDQVQRAANNATASERRHTFRPIVFCSTGYDSSCCAAFGREIGCDNAVVFTSSRGSRNDSGRAIVEQLGYSRVLEKADREYRSYERAEEFVATGELATSVYMAAVVDELRGTYVLSGVHGDKVWGRSYKYAGRELIRSFLPDTARKEFRLATGFFFFPIPFIAAMRHEEICRISNSTEMQPWQIGGDYDRPIPRRIVESAGVPRELFGVDKSSGVGNSFRLGSLGNLRRVMPRDAYARFERYYVRARKERRMSRYSLARYAAYFILLVAVSTYRFRPLLKRLLRISDWPINYQCSPWAPSLLFCWGTQELRPRYAGVKQLRDLHDLAKK